ncbi:MAG: Oxidoreductase, short chain dehydrogenase/reductase family [Myxococcaceae bacterium]|nr:Oxidoreductase, short chain dehydrogenase/reductase family [Myxococcaceae bacterium]
MTWADRSVLITGASRGLGFALARELGLRGARIAIVSPHAGRLTEAVARLAAEGIGVLPIRGDVGDKEASHNIVGQAQALLGPIDVLIHNASTLGPSPLVSLLDTECEDFVRALEVNLIGPFRLSKAIAAGMVLRGRGLIVHVSSDAAVETYPDWGAYGISKAALDKLSRQWAAELGGTAVRVLSIDPGEMATDMHREALPESDPQSLLAPADVAQRFLRIFEDSARYPSGARVSASEAAS